MNEIKNYLNSSETIKERVISREFFKNVLNTLCDDKDISIVKMRKIFEEKKNDITNMSIKYNEMLDEFVIGNICIYEKMRVSEVFTNFLQFWKFFFFIKEMTTDNTNQVISNTLHLLNKLLDETLAKDDEFITDNIDNFILLLELDVDITIKVNSFNPRIEIYFERTINLIESHKSIIEDTTMQLFFGIVKNYLSFLSKDINYQILFEYLEYKLSEFKTLQPFLKEQKEFSQISKENKILPMNFLIIKPKPIPSLEPEYDLPFMDGFETNEEEQKKKMERIMKKKIQSTKKQAIRKLKKEAIVIDSERQKVLMNIDKKRKEDLKLTNQFIEEQNIEMKKLMTMNEKRRFKIKKNKRNKK